MVAGEAPTAPASRGLVVVRPHVVRPHVVRVSSQGGSPVSRRYADPVEVRLAEVPADPDVSVASAGPEGPAAFLWRGRVYLVREVLAEWVEAGAWWRAAGGDPGDPGGSGDAGDRRVWRVAAAAGRTAPVGVFDLSCQAGRWRLARSLD